PVFNVVNDDHAAGAEEPGAACGHDADGASAKDHDRVAALDAGHFGGLIAGGHDVGQKDRIIEVHAGRDLGRADIGIGYAYIFGLAAIIAAGRMRIAKNAANSGRFGIGLVAIAEQALLAEMAFAAGDVERDDNVVAGLEVFYLGADFLD